MEISQEGCIIINILELSHLLEILIFCRGSKIFADIKHTYHTENNKNEKRVELQ